MGVARSARKPRIITPRIITEIIPKNEGNFDQIVLNIKEIINSPDTVPFYPEAEIPKKINNIDVFSNKYEPPEYQRSYWIPVSTAPFSEQFLKDNKIKYILYKKGDGVRSDGVWFQDGFGYIFDGITYAEIVERFNIKPINMYSCEENGLRFVELKVNTTKKIAYNAVKQLENVKRKIKYSLYDISRIIYILLMVFIFIYSISKIIGVS